MFKYYIQKIYIPIEFYLSGNAWEEIGNASVSLKTKKKERKKSCTVF